VLRCACRAEAPSKAVVAFVVGSFWSLASVDQSGDGSAVSGRGKFQSTSTRRYLGIVPGSRRAW
jgi:hypothetical protein